MDLQEESIVSVKWSSGLIDNFLICSVEMDVVEIWARAQRNSRSRLSKFVVGMGSNHLADELKLTKIIYAIEK